MASKKRKQANAEAKAAEPEHSARDQQSPQNSSQENSRHASEQPSPEPSPEPVSKKKARKLKGPRPSVEYVEVDSDEEDALKRNQLKGAGKGLSMANMLNPSAVTVSIEDDEDDEEAPTRPTATRRQTRSSLGDAAPRADFSYDMKWHPMDIVTRPAQAARRGLATRSLTSSRGRMDSHETSPESTPTLADDEEKDDEDEEHSDLAASQMPKEREADPKAMRVSTRAAARKMVNYNRKVHPQDRYLLDTRKRRSSSTPQNEPLKENKKRSSEPIMQNSSRRSRARQPSIKKSQKTQQAIHMGSPIPLSSPAADADSPQDTDANSNPGFIKLSGALAQEGDDNLPQSPTPARSLDRPQTTQAHIDPNEDGDEEKDNEQENEVNEGGVLHQEQSDDDDFLNAFESVAEENIQLEAENLAEPGDGSTSEEDSLSQNPATPNRQSGLGHTSDAGGSNPSESDAEILGFAGLFENKPILSQRPRVLAPIGPNVIRHNTQPDMLTNQKPFKSRGPQSPVRTSSRTLSNCSSTAPPTKHHLYESALRFAGTGAPHKTTTMADHSVDRTFEPSTHFSATTPTTMAELDLPSSHMPSPERNPPSIFGNGRDLDEENMFLDSAASSGNANLDLALASANAAGGITAYAAPPSGQGH